MIALLKSVHIAGLVLWCAGLIILPILLGFHRHILRNNAAARNYMQFRLLTHRCYTMVATPSAIIAIAAGTMLIFAARVYEPWLLAKLAAVSGMVIAHAWLGHLVLLAGERPADWRMPPAVLALVLALPSMVAVLWLVLAKPDMSPMARALPVWLTEPLQLDMPAALQEVLP